MSVLILSGTYLSDCMMQNGHGWGMMNSWTGGLIMWIFFILIIFLLVYIATRIIKPGLPTSPGAGKETPLDIIKRRYAEGQITKEEFESMKKDLQR